jgi:Leucine-rich repeat (LRR) protein
MSGRRGSLGRLAVVCFAALACVGVCREPAAPPRMPVDQRAAARRALAEQIAAVRAGEATRIEVSTGPLRDEDLAALTDLPNLETLVLRSTDVSDAAAEQISRLSQLTRLVLGQTRISDRGLARLCELAQLRDLNLDATAITDAGLPALRNLTHLTALRFGQSELTSAGLDTIGALGGLQFLILQHAHLTGPGLLKLTGLTQLQSLYLQGNDIDEADLAAFENAIAPRSVHIHE